MMICKGIKRIFILIILGILLSLTTFSYAKEIPFTQDDRDRLIRLEEGQRSLQRQIEEGLKATNQRIDDLRDLIYVVIAGMIALVGFVIWDRRSALAPAIKKNKELEEREERIEKALKELAKKDPNVAEALKHVGLL